MTGLTRFTKKTAKKFLAIAIGIACLFAIIFAYNITITENQHLVYLADSFLHGKLYFQENHLQYLVVFKNVNEKTWTDTSEWLGKHYWPLGPFPAVVLLPFVAAFGTHFLQGYISFFLTVLNFYLLWRIAKKFVSSPGDALWLACFFIFGSSYLGVAAFPVSWYFEQVIATTLLLGALYEFFKDRGDGIQSAKIRWWLIGIYVACALATRNTLVLAAVFFLLMCCGVKEPSQKILRILQLLSPIIISIIILLAYNYARFGNPFESGYKLQDLSEELKTVRSLGLFGIAYIPHNLYLLFFKGLEPVLATTKSYVLKYPFIRVTTGGLSIFFSAPLLIYIFNAPWKEKIVKASWLTSLLLFIPIITYYGIGVSRIGNRYILDLYPFLYLLLCASLKPKLTMPAKVLIILGIVLNFHLLLQYQSW